jgi:hypothetical protein
MAIQRVSHRKGDSPLGLTEKQVQVPGSKNTTVTRPLTASNPCATPPSPGARTT